MTVLPAPSPQYDARNEAETRRSIEQALARLSSNVPDVGGAALGGSGTTGKVPLWTGPTTLGDSDIDVANIAYLSDLFTQADADARYSLLGHTHTASEVTDFNAAGDARWWKLGETSLPGPLDIGDVTGMGPALLRVGGKIGASDEVDALDFVLVGGAAGGGAAAALFSVLDEGVLKSSAVSSINFVGGGVQATAVGDAITVSITFDQAAADARYALLGHTHTSADITDFASAVATAGDLRYLLLSGGTLTGALNGTTAAFSGEVDADDFVLVGGTGGGGAAAALFSVLDEGVLKANSVTSINFVGAGVAASAVGDAVTVTISFDQAAADARYVQRFGSGQSVVNLALAGDINPYIQFNDGTYNAYWQMASGSMQLIHGGTTRMSAAAPGGMQTFGSWDFLKADGSAHLLNLVDGGAATFNLPVYMGGNHIFTQAGGVYLNAGIVGYDSEVFTARGASVPHYGWKWTTTTDIAGDSNVRLLGGGYGGISLFTGGVERVRIDIGGATHFYFGTDFAGAVYSASTITGAAFASASQVTSGVPWFRLSTAGVSPGVPRLEFGTDGSGYAFEIGQNVGGSYTGYARFYDQTYGGALRLMGPYGFMLGAHISGVPSVRYGAIVSGEYDFLNTANGYAGVNLSTVRFYDTGPYFTHWNDNYVQLSPGGSLTAGGLLMYVSGAVRGYFYADTSGIGILHSAGNWVLRNPYGTADIVITGTTTGSDFILS